MGFQPLSAELAALIVVLRQSGLSARAVARELGLSRSTVDNYYTVRQPRLLTPERKAELARLEAAGVSRAEMCRRLGHSHRAIRSALGTSPKVNPFDRDTIARIQALCRDHGWGYRRIAKHLGVSNNKVRKHVHGIHPPRRKGPPVTPEIEREILALRRQQVPHKVIARRLGIAPATSAQHATRPRFHPAQSL